MATDNTGIDINAHRNQDEVPMPEIGLCLDWSQETLLNGTITASTLMPDAQKELRSPISHTPSKYQWPLKRTRLPILRVITGENGKITCAPHPGQSLRLDKLLAQGDNVQSLVFECTVLPLGSKVVLKLLTDQYNKVPSNIHVGEDVYFDFDWRKDNLGKTAQMHLSCEADRFRDMAPLQGSFVPWSYGFYEFTLPNSPSVVGHVMEYVPSVNIAHFYNTAVKGKPSIVDFFLTLLYRTYIEVHRHNVAHQDIGLRNLRLHLDKSAMPMQFTLVDFTCSTSIEYCKRTNLSWTAAEAAFMELMLDEELDAISTNNWLATPNGQHLKELFIKDAEELAKLDP